MGRRILTNDNRKQEMLTPRGKSFNESWDIFKELLVPDDASENQILDMKMAFYSGAYRMMHNYTMKATSLEEAQKEMETRSIQITEDNKQVVDFINELYLRTSKPEGTA